MSTILTTITVGASVLGLLYAIILRAASWPSRWKVLASAGLRPLLIFIAGWIAMLFLLTVPSAPPFAAGMTLGWGFLIGSLIGLFVLVETVVDGEGGGRNAGTVGVLSTAALGPSLILLLFPGYPNEALVGCALGAVFVAGIAVSIINPLLANAAGDTANITARGIEIFALLTVAVAVGARLAIDHFDKPATAAIAGGYRVFPALMVAAGALASILWSSQGSGKWQRWAPFFNGLGVAAVAAVLTIVLQVRLLTELAWPLTLYGLLAFGFLLAVFTRQRQVEEENESRPVTLAFAAVLLALAVIAVAFQRLQGYGEVLALLPALLLVAVIYLNGRAQEPLGEALGLGGVSIMLLLACYRLFLETAGHGWTLDFQQQYDLFALLLGAGACFGLLAFTARSRQVTAAVKGPLGILCIRTTFLGVLLAVIPLALVAVWGVKAAGAFLAGLVVGEAVWMLLAAWVVGTERERVIAVVPHLFFVATALVAIQLSHVVLALDISRLAKLAVLGSITFLLLIWIFLDALAQTRRVEREKFLTTKTRSTQKDISLQ